MKAWKQYLAAAAALIAAGAVAYMTGCSDVYFASGVSVDCNSFSVSFGAGECQSGFLLPDEEGIDIPEIVQTPPPAGAQAGDGGGASPSDRSRGGPGTRPGGRSGSDPGDSGGRGSDSPEGGGSDSPPEPSYNKLTFEVIAGKALFVIGVDNSSSMHPEHKSYARRQVPKMLRAIKHIPYKLAVVSSDISSSPGNPVQGANYQDGNFIPFALSGRKWLENTNIGGNPDPYDVEDLQKTIVRPETIACDQNSDDNARDCYRETSLGRYSDVEECEEAQAQDVSCPSSDERIIYAYNLALENPAHRDFFEAGAHAFFIPFSDEDERSGKEYIQNADTGGIDYSFESKDEPITLVETAYSLHPMMTLSFYPVIVPPGDSACLAEQNQNSHGGAGTGRGYYGETYAKLAIADSELTGRGNLIRGAVLSICNRNFGAQMKKVSVSAQIPRIPIPCTHPGWIGIKVNGKRANHLKPKLKGRSLEFEDAAVPIGSKVSATVYCPA